MFFRWLDRWDERRALLGDATKMVSDFVLDAELAFPDAKGTRSIEQFGDHAEHAVANPAFFDEPNGAEARVRWKEGWIIFPSSLSTDIEENNTVWGRVTEARRSDHALLVFHHWNASSRYPLLAHFFARRGITVVEIAMPYHFERRRPSAPHADYMLSPNLGRTIQSMRQAVLDGRKLIRILENSGYKKFSVLGLSLGSWVAGLVAAHDLAVGRAALFLTAGDLADMVWTGRATRHIRASLQGEMHVTELRRAWSPLSLDNYANRLARPELALQLVIAKRDTVVLPELSERLIAKLREAGAEPNMLVMNCGHYSLSLPPYIVRAVSSVWRLLEHSP